MIALFIVISVIVVVYFVMRKLNKDLSNDWKELLSATSYMTESQKRDQELADILIRQAQERMAFQRETVERTEELRIKTEQRKRLRHNSRNTFIFDIGLKYDDDPRMVLPFEKKGFKVPQSGMRSMSSYTTARKDMYADERY